MSPPTDSMSSGSSMARPTRPSSRLNDRNPGTTQPSSSSMTAVARS